MIGDLELGAERAGLRIDRRADARDRAGEARAAERVDDDVGRLPGRELAELLLRHVHVGDQRVEVRDPERRVVRR